MFIALVDDNDTGTAFEAGYAHAFNKPLILVSQGDCSAANAMLIGAAKMLVNNVLEEGQQDILKSNGKIDAKMGVDPVDASAETRLDI